MSAKASLLAIGNELTSGQIINRNAAWIAQRLADVGIETVRHLAVRDQKAEIVGAIGEIARDAELLFLTGGLGPTSDDLTRDAVAAWLGVEMEYYAPAWD